MKPFARMVEKFARCRDGGMTILSLFIVMAMLITGGIAVDYANLHAEKQQLQITAESVAHAALLTSEKKTQAEAIQAGLAMAERNMPASVYGKVVDAKDIVFGYWDRPTSTFVPNAPPPPNVGLAVQVTTHRSAAGGNAIAALFYKSLGINSWDARAQATYERYKSACLHDGMLANGYVNIQSNNTFINKFCLHSNDHVVMNSNNYFEGGVYVSMPDLANLQLPMSGLTSNLGLGDALTYGSMDLRVLDTLAWRIQNLYDPKWDGQPDYIRSAVVKDINLITVKNAGETAFFKNRVNIAVCLSESSTIQIAANSLLQNLVFVTNCQIRFGANVRVEDVIIATSNTALDSMSAPSGLVLGKNDNCAPGGGAILLSMGSIRTAANLEMYNSQIIVMGSMNFAARANGMMGASIIAGGNIDSTSAINMGLCLDGFQGIEADYFHMVN